ncbi:MAG: glycosyltransferase family 9 protein, partial [Alphaproteobacteria bacterium]|nr:glycosyltransferase family 9 protein [Alphaproteobacteria bacterium]
KIHYNLGLVHRDLGHLLEAEDCFRRAELLGYDKADLRWDHALLDLLQGKLEKGFIGFEARWQLEDCHPHFPEIPIWKGAPLVGQVLMVYAEHGIGDAIQFARYLPYLHDKAETIVFYCDPSIKRLIQSSPDSRDVSVYGFGEELPEDIDAVIPLLSLPRVLGTTSETIPAKTPYLAAPETDVPAINKTGLSRLRVGLVWSGDIHHKNDTNRSIDLGYFSQILDLPNIQFYSFQVGPRESDLHENCFDPVIRNLAPHIRDFADTARLIKDMDLIISVDTAVAHLAGALNVPVWTLLPFAPDWRWQMVRGDSPWYPSMSLIRQTSPGDWREVIHRVRNRLIGLLHDTEEMVELELSDHDSTD